MAIISISRGSYSKGKEVAEKVAAKLGYQCIAREVVIEAAREFNIPEVKLIRALHDAPSVLDRFTFGKERYVAYFQAAFLKCMKDDDVVYHGLAGHFFLRDIGHALKVRIVADMNDRVRLEMARENISEMEAVQMLRKDDEERKSWGKQLYGIDTSDSLLYDMVINTRKISSDEAAEAICHMAGMESFRTTPEARGALHDRLLSAEVKAALIDIRPDIKVFARNGHVVAGTSSILVSNPEMIDRIRKVAMGVPGVTAVDFKASHLVEWSE